MAQSGRSTYSNMCANLCGMARAWVELPHGWGPQQVIITAWKRAGYKADRLVCGGDVDDPDLLIFNGVRPS